MILVPTVTIAYTIIPSEVVHCLIWVLWLLLPVLHKIAEVFEFAPEWHAIVKLLGIKLED